MTLIALLENLASDTWSRLRDSQSLQIRFGEETITDLLLLDLKRLNKTQSQIIQTPKSKEKSLGTDWEWWIGSPRIGWLRYAVQAKKMNLKTSRYDGLSHKVGVIKQIDLLDRYASNNNAIPMYCFYNYSRNLATKQAWQCCSVFQQDQLSCTVAPSNIVRKAINQHGAKNFCWFHMKPQTLPWRCLVKCQHVKSLYKRTINYSKRRDAAIRLFGHEVKLYDRLPREVERGREIGQIDRFSNMSYDNNLSLYPRRIVVLEFESSEDGYNISN